MVAVIADVGGQHLSPQSRQRLSPQARRAQLIAVGVQLLQDRPLTDLALEDVAAAAGISRALPFHYFASRTEFHVAVLEAAGEEFLRATDPAPQLPPHDRLRAGIEAYLDWAGARRSEYLALTRSAAGADPALREVFERSRDALVDRLVLGMDADPAEPLLRLAVRGWAAMTEEMVAAWSQQRPVPRADLVAVIEQAFTSSVAAVAHRVPSARAAIDRYIHLGGTCDQR
jgi:AcrR family transcriptional regulator